VKSLRQLHLYLGCLFSPLLIYFCASGTWQVFRLNDVPKDVPPSWPRTLLHALSAPHTHSVLPGTDPRHFHSVLFMGMASLMALGIVLTSGIGLALAIRFGRHPRLVGLCIAAGVLLPVIFLFFYTASGS
jgi:hypothetical protein